MTLLMNIDPSKPGNNTGWSLFRGHVLIQCGLHVQELPPRHVLPVDVLLIELPQVYPGARAEDPNDLIQVARSVGQWEVCVPHTRLVHVHPRAWKGTIKKEIMCKRIKACLTVSELGLLPKLPESKIHNVLDAVGLGLWHTGRLGQGGRRFGFEAATD